MAQEESEKLRAHVAGRLAVEFLERIGITHTLKWPAPALTVIGGAPGSGKTTAARMLAYVSGSIHVQANSARWLLSEHGFPYGKNVHLVMRDVIDNLLSRRVRVVLDGMLIGKEERQLARDIAKKHNAKVFFVAMVCDPKIAEERARARYADGRHSNFLDWRARPANTEGYMGSIAERTAKLNEVLAQAPNEPETGIWRLDNNSTMGDLESCISPTWNYIEHKLDLARGR